METFFGINFLDSEYRITNGRIDSIGIDENDCPVIFEYKRSVGENIINQGLFYLDWLLDHKADFKLLVIDKLGEERANQIDWSNPCVICIASDFTKFDVHAVNQMQKNIKLVRYKLSGEGLILLEQINAPVVKAIEYATTISSNKKSGKNKTFDEQTQATIVDMQNLYNSIRDYILSLGDDITEHKLKEYIAYRKIKNVIALKTRSKGIIVHLRLNPNSVQMIEGFCRDISGTHHFTVGVSKVELTIKDSKDFELSKDYILKSYQSN